MIEMRELRMGAPAPNFRLVDGHGSEVELVAYRRRQPVVLIFMGEQIDEDRLRAFAEMAAEFQAEGIQILAIIRGSAADANQLIQRLDVPFPVLADVDGMVHQVYLGEDVVGQLLLDRYNAVQVKESGSDAARFMPPVDVLSWATFGEFSCSSTGIVKH